MAEAIGSAVGVILGVALLAAPIVGVGLLVRWFRRRGSTSAGQAGRTAASSHPTDPPAPDGSGAFASVPIGPSSEDVRGSVPVGRTTPPVVRLRASLQPRFGTPRSRRILALVALAALVVLNVSDRIGDRPGSGASGAGGIDTAPPGTWVTLSDPGGVTLSAPAGWRLDAALAASVTAAYGAERSGMVAVVSPDTQVLIWPLFIASTGTPPDPGVILDGYVNRLVPAAGLPSSLPLDARMATTSGRDGGTDILAAIVLADPSPAGTAATLYLVRSSDLIASSETLAQVMASVRVRGTPVQDAPAGSLRFTRVMASDEPAFTVEVPSDWSYNATLERRSGTVYNPSVALRSPDGGTTILWSGVTGSPLFPLFAITGLIIHPEGATWSAIDGTTRIIRSPQPAEVLARESLSGVTDWIGCGTPEVTGTTARPDLAEVVARGWTAWVASADYDAVELQFRCGSATGVVRTVTEYVGYAMNDPTISFQPKLWGVKQHLAYVAPPGGEVTAELVIARLYASFAYETAWYSQQLGLQAGLSEIVTNAGREMSEIINRGYEGRQEVYDALSQRRSDAIRGVERVEDTFTGRTYEVESGSSYYWIDDRGTVVGTDVATAPDIDFRALLRG